MRVLKYSTEELLKDLRRVYREAGRARFSFPIYEERGRYAATTVAHRFGSWREACRAAGIEPVRRGPHWQSRFLKAVEIRVMVSCLKCDQPFPSWDPKKNRLCPGCTAANDRIVDDQRYQVAL